MKICLEADLHVHSIASGHAFSTIQKLSEAAAKRGLKMIALTDHGPNYQVLLMNFISIGYLIFLKSLMGWKY